MGAPFYVSPGAQAILDRKASGTKPAQIHRYDVKINTRDRCCTHDDVTMGTPKKSSPDGNGVHHHYVTVNVPARLGQYESTGSPDEGGVTQEGVKPGNAAKGIEDTGTGGGNDWKEHLLAYLHKLDARVTAIEKGRGETVEDIRDPSRSDVHQPRGEEAAKSPIANMHTLTFREPERGENDQLGLLGGLARGAGAVAGGLARGAGDVARGVGRVAEEVTPSIVQYELNERERKKQEREQQQADSPRAALAQKAHGLAPGLPLKASEARSMTSPGRGPQSPLEDRHQRGEARPRAIIATYPKGDPFRAGGMSAGPEAPSGQSGGGRERTRLDASTGTSKYGFRESYPVGDSKPSTTDIIRNLARRENEAMRRIKDEIAIVIKSRWN